MHNITSAQQQPLQSSAPPTQVPTPSSLAPLMQQTEQQPPTQPFAAAEEAAVLAAAAATPCEAQTQQPTFGPLTRAQTAEVARKRAQRNRKRRSTADPTAVATAAAGAAASAVAPITTQTASSSELAPTQDNLRLIAVHTEHIITLAKAASKVKRRIKQIESRQDAAHRASLPPTPQLFNSESDSSTQ